MLCHPEPHPMVSYALRNAKSRYPMKPVHKGGVDGLHPLCCGAGGVDKRSNPEFVKINDVPFVSTLTPSRPLRGEEKI